MRLKSDEIRSLILKAAMQAFLEKGFHAASLRDMANTLNGTTGLIYTYFKNKNDLFETLVRPVISAFENRLAAEDLPIKDAVEKQGMRPKAWFTKNLHFMIGLIEKYPDEMKLLFLKADGSSLHHYKNHLIEQGTIRSLAAFRTLERSKDFEGQELSEFFVINLVNFVINIVVEILKDNKKPEEIAIFENEISSFLFSGWKALVRL